MWLKRVPIFKIHTHHFSEKLVVSIIKKLHYADYELLSCLNV